MLFRERSPSPQPSPPGEGEESALARFMSSARNTGFRGILIHPALPMGEGAEGWVRGLCRFGKCFVRSYREQISEKN
jgi:hypothetical protein